MIIHFNKCKSNDFLKICVKHERIVSAKLKKSYIFVQNHQIMEIDSLLQVSLFSGIDKYELKNFIDNIPNAYHIYHQDEYIAVQGDTCNSIYILCDGHVRTSMISQTGKEITVEDIYSPNVLAPAFIYTSTNLFPVSVRSMGECEVLVLNKNSYFKWMQENDTILSNFLHVISDRCIFLSKKVNSFALLDLKSRLAMYLLDKGDNFETQQQIADRLGVARPSITRILAEFEDNGCIKIERRNINVISERKLQQYL